MSRSFPFAYYESFTDKTLETTIDALKIKGNSNAELLLILRLLSGAIKVEHKDSEYQFTQKINYCTSDFKPYNQKWNEKFPGLLGDGFTDEQLADFIEFSKYRSNRKFYKNILSELSYFCYYSHKKSHASAFIFLYRVLEHISYALPLIYASKTDSFTNTYTLLKELLSEDNSAGELRFFKTFIQKVFKESPLLESSIDFEMTRPTVEDQEYMFDELKKSCARSALSEATDEPRVLSIKFGETGSFLANVRNRFFHFMNGHENNINSSNIKNIDGLFAIVNKAGLFWVTTIFLEVVAYSANYYLTVKNQE
ncbi:hypothetical protein DXV75_16940 [Alteromonas aestuariivivens]|uniref:Uncharacterized protein n=1 Tax=Alteromonas aestuariivivens TaxID=1938339 RepID=A0A3D8M2N5_9ALTE|nr:hypothetical protein [Alteromonas aestuariivivens]RDV23876.1 hypothetical protein DXV75_16940 [Alteromonas aestuariivivens]